jgi:type IV pilus assembly protein PilB
VFSTLHANSAAESIIRLVNMGIPRHQLASALSLIIAQRLVRRLCTHGCEKGCQHCQKGYKGRIGVYECMSITPAISQLILEEAPASVIQEEACLEGMQTLQMSGLQKVQQGVTNMTEIQRVLQS